MPVEPTQLRGDGSVQFKSHEDSLVKASTSLSQLASYTHHCALAAFQEWPPAFSIARRYRTELLLLGWGQAVPATARH